MNKNDDPSPVPRGAMAVDVMLDSGALEILGSLVWYALTRCLHNARTWASSELRTPGNSPQPVVTISEPGPWNGVVVIEADQPAFWLLAKAGPGRPGVAADPRVLGNPSASQPSGSSNSWRRPQAPDHHHFERDYSDDPFLDDVLWRRP